MKLPGFFLAAPAALLLATAGYSQPLSVEVTERPDRYGKFFYVRNVLQKPITGIAFASTTYTKEGQVADVYPSFYDSIMDLKRGQLVPAILPGHTWTVHVGRGRTAGMSGERKEENAVRTLLFADGTSEGDPVWIQKLLQRRRAALRASRAIWNVLSEARRNNTTRTVLADQLGKLQKKLTADLHLYSPTNIPPEQAIKTEFFGIMDMFAVAGNLWDRYLVERHKGESAKELASTVQSVDSLLRKLEDRLQRNPPAPLVAR